MDGEVLWVVARRPNRFLEKACPRLGDRLRWMLGSACVPGDNGFGLSVIIPCGNTLGPAPGKIEDPLLPVVTGYWPSGLCPPGVVAGLGFAP